MFPQIWKEVDLQFKNPLQSLVGHSDPYSSYQLFVTTFNISIISFRFSSKISHTSPLHWGWAGARLSSPLRCSAFPVLSYSTLPLAEGFQISRRRLWKGKSPGRRKKEWIPASAVAGKPWQKSNGPLSLSSATSLSQSGESLSPSLSRSSALALSHQPGPLCIPLPETVSVHSCCAKRHWSAACCTRLSVHTHSFNHVNTLQ